MQSFAIITYQLADEENIYTFYSACWQAGLKPIFHPFWVALPFSDIFISITPNILYQLLQRMIKHLIKCVTVLLLDVGTTPRIKKKGSRRVEMTT